MCVDFRVILFINEGRMLVYVVFDIVWSCGMIVVSPCCRRWRYNLNEPLDPLSFLGGC